MNTESAIAIAKVCRERAKRMVFISTEQCFNAAPGKAPFFEDDEQASVSAYGRQKMEADAWIRENLSDYLILRFSWMFGLSMARASRPRRTSSATSLPPSGAISPRRFASMSCAT